MTKGFDPRLDTLAAAQREIWNALAVAAQLAYVLYGGTALALRLGHRQSVDFDFFGAAPLDKDGLRGSFPFMARATILQDEVDTLVILANMRSGAVKVSFFGGISFDRVNDPERTSDGALLVASLDDLLATKLKAILDRAEARDYRDIAAMLRAGVSLAKGLAAFKGMFAGEPATVLRAIGYFADGDLNTLGPVDRLLLRQQRDEIGDLPAVALKPGLL